MWCAPQGCSLLCIPGLLWRFFPTCWHIPTLQALSTMLDTVPKSGARVPMHSTATIVMCTRGLYFIVYPRPAAEIPPTYRHIPTVQAFCTMVDTVRNPGRRFAVHSIPTMSIYCVSPACGRDSPQLARTYPPRRFTSVFPIAISHTYVSTIPPNMFGTHIVTCRTPPCRGWWLIPVLRRTSLALSNPTLTSVTTITTVLVTTSNPLRFGRSDARAMPL
ncbi:hypothetical protein Cgig2_005977 [Carnegiea gigantea]|uniref:Secreted protein n=1 Tax=Carnegiea gigantea TaxID=171969 RepID=A0A9Q1KIZ8_9CARY|nr:hypothetical protein Cgig2_005977 [Carnegiea gigantea]